MCLSKRELYNSETSKWSSESKILSIDNNNHWLKKNLLINYRRQIKRLTTSKKSKCIQKNNSREVEESVKLCLDV